MNLDACIKKISKYLNSSNGQPLLVNIQNKKDLDAILTQFNVEGNRVVCASEYCKKDELPRLDVLWNDISSSYDNIFLTELSTFIRFKGEDELKRRLHDIITSAIKGHVVVLLYQCGRNISFNDPRLERNICMIEGEEDRLPQIILLNKNISSINEGRRANGIDEVAYWIENSNEDRIYVATDKTKDKYAKSIYDIGEVLSSYDLIIKQDQAISEVNISLGTDNNWMYLHTLINYRNSFMEVCNDEFGSFQALEMAIPNYVEFNENKKWLYFLALKVFGSPNNAYLDFISKKIDNSQSLIRCIFRGLLEVKYTENNYEKLYKERKSIILKLGNPKDEAADYCKYILQKEENAIYYLTDNTQQEKEEIIKLISQYYQDCSKNELEKILHIVYPDLYNYLQDYNYDNDILNRYFSLYTHSKVINKVIPELESIMSEQAISREYNVMLQPRTVEMYNIDKSDSQLYFMDAMGVEYLSYIISKCKEKHLIANVNICTSNLPSITCMNKEFIQEFEQAGIKINSIKDLDELKHHGVNNYDYTKQKMPYHIIRELEVLDETLDNIDGKLIQGECSKAIMVADHGASRLAVIHETENMWEMVSSGEHSGRCCPVDDADVQSEFATEENGFWVLANYDRFKGGRKANVEVHGGATLEEVVVPIIEISRLPENIEVSIIDKVIYVSFRKKASIRLFSTTNLSNITIKVEGKYYKAEAMKNNIFVVNMPDLKKARKYNVDVYMSNNLIVSGLNFEIKKEGSQERDLF